MAACVAYRGLFDNLEGKAIACSLQRTVPEQNKKRKVIREISYDLSIWCGKQDLKSGRAVHNGHLCITRYNSKTNLYNTDKPKPP